MFIPVSIELGQVFVTTLLKLSGVLVAECGVTYKGVTYEALEPVQVVIDTEITFFHDVSEPTDVKITIGEDTFTWYIREANATSYVSGDGYSDLKGALASIYVDGTSKQLQLGEVGENRLVQIDVGVPGVLLIDIDTGNVKRFDLTETPLDFKITPMSQDGYNQTYIGVLTRTTLYVFDRDLVLINTFVLHQPEARALTSYDGVFHVQFNHVTIRSMYYNPVFGYLGNGSVSGTKFDQVIDAGPLIVRRLGFHVYAQEHLRGTANPSFQLESFTQNSQIAASSSMKHVTVVDKGTNILYVYDYINASTQSLSNRRVLHLKYVPSDVLLTYVDGVVEILVGYFDSNTEVYKLNGSDIVLDRELTTGGTSFLANVEGRVVATRLYTSPVVKFLEPRIVETTPQYRNVSEPITIKYEHNAPRPLRAELLSNNAVVTIDYKPFTGVLPTSCTVRITVPASERYYEFLQVGLIGTETILFNVRSEPRLFGDMQNLTRIYDAAMRTYYYDQFTVIGVTEGFEVGIKITTDLTALRINGGEWVDEGIVRLGDVVETRWFLPRYGAPYTLNNDIVTVPALKVLARWPILKMSLDGVETPGWDERINDRFEVAKSNEVLTVPVDIYTGGGVRISAELHQASLDGTALPGLSTFQVDLNSAPPLRQRIAFGSNSEVMQSNTTHSPHSVDGYISVYSHRIENIGVAGGVYGALGDAVGAPNTMFLEPITQPHFDITGYAYRDGVGVPLEVYATETYTAAMIINDIGNSFEGGFGTYTVTPSVERNVKASKSTISPTITRTPYVNTGTFSHTTRLRTTLVKSVVAVVGYTEKPVRREAVEVAGDLNVKPLRVSASVTPTLQMSRHFALGSNDGDFAQRNVCVTFQTTWAVMQTRIAQDVGVSADVLHGITHIETSLEPIHTFAHTEKFVPEFHVVPTNFKDVDISGGVLTEAEALAYAASLNMGDADIVVESEDGNFFVLSNPLLGMSECIAGLPPQDKMKVFGYLGGG